MLKVHAKKLGTTIALSVEGQIVNGETETLRNALDLLAENSVVKLDLARVTIVDAHGLGVLLEMRARTLEKGLRFELMNVSEPMSRVLEITRLNTVFQISSQVEFFPTVSRYREPESAAA
jgi:anti-anti-sigma factor